MANFVGTALAPLEKAYQGAKELYLRIEQLRVNDRQKRELLDNINIVKKILEHMITVEREISCTPETLHDSLQKVERILETCKRICEEISKNNLLIKVVQAYGALEKLTELNRQLVNAIGILNACIGMTSLEFHKDMRKQMNRVEGIARNPSAGIYPEVGTVLKEPGVVDRPVIENDGNDFLRVQWSDKRNPPGSLLCYEIQYGEHNRHSIRVPPNSTACRLGHEVLEPGNTYSIRVRGVNSRGPGKWSERAVCRFKKCPPKQPQKPLDARVESPTSITLVINNPNTCLGTRDITRVMIEYCDENSSDWTIEPFAIYGNSKTMIQYQFTELSPDTTYQFRVKVQNADGDVSLPSESIVAKTNNPTPGPPVCLRVSSYRTTDTIKIRWKAPFHNSHAVRYYEVEWHRKSDSSQFGKTRKTSFKATGLKHDTMFEFRVRAFNKESRCSDWSEWIKAETRMKGSRKAKAVAAGIGAGIAATVGAPLIGAIGGGVLAGDSAVESVEEKGGGKGAKGAAGTAAGIAGGIGGTFLCTIGAPLVGIVTGIGVGMAVMEEDLSDQSDDEEESPIID